MRRLKAWRVGERRSYRNCIYVDDLPRMNRNCTLAKGWFRARCGWNSHLAIQHTETTRSKTIVPQVTDANGLLPPTQCSLVLPFPFLVSHSRLWYLGNRYACCSSHQRDGTIEEYSLGTYRKIQRCWFGLVWLERGVWWLPSHLIIDKIFWIDSTHLRS